MKTFNASDHLVTACTAGAPGNGIVPVLQADVEQASCRDARPGSGLGLLLLGVIAGGAAFCATLVTGGGLLAAFLVNALVGTATILGAAALLVRGHVE